VIRRVHHPCQHSDDPDEQLLALLPVSFRDDATPHEDVQDGPAFPRRSASNLEKPATFCGRELAASFGDVQRDRLRGA
jgi:hypothetical protein